MLKKLRKWWHDLRIEWAEDDRMYTVAEINAARNKLVLQTARLEKLMGTRP